MGGKGSNRWGGYRCKTTVEDCLKFNVQYLPRNPKTKRLALKDWRILYGWQTVYVDETRPACLRILRFSPGRQASTMAWCGLDGKPIQQILIVTTEQQPNLLRHWWRCPRCGR